MKWMGTQPIHLHFKGAEETFVVVKPVVVAACSAVTCCFHQLFIS
jgi:hypothetical protein